MKYRIQGEITIYIDYEEEDADSKEHALKMAKEWAKDEYRIHSMAWDDYDISLTAEEVEEEEDATSPNQLASLGS